MEPITATDLDTWARRFVGKSHTRAVLHRAAHTIRSMALSIDALERSHAQQSAKISAMELQNGELKFELSMSNVVTEQYAADAELGALIRRIREHAEAGRVAVHLDEGGGAGSHFRFLASELRILLADLDRIATRRQQVALEGAISPRGLRCKVVDGKLWHWSEQHKEWFQTQNIHPKDAAFVARLFKKAQFADLGYL